VRYQILYQPSCQVLRRLTLLLPIAHLSDRRARGWRAGDPYRSTSPVPLSFPVAQHPETPLRHTRIHVL
jgi:hypothetical protein